MLSFPNKVHFVGNLFSVLCSVAQCNGLAIKDLGLSVYRCVSDRSLCYSSSWSVRNDNDRRRADLWCCTHAACTPTGTHAGHKSGPSFGTAQQQVGCPVHARGGESGRGGGGSWLAASNDGGGSFGTKPYYQRESEKTKPVTTQERDQRVIPIRQPQSNPTVENTHFPLLLRSLDRVLEHVVRCVQSTSPTSRAPSSVSKFEK